MDYNFEKRGPKLSTSKECEVTRGRSMLSNIRKLRAVRVSGHWTELYAGVGGTVELYIADDSKPTTTEGLQGYPGGRIYTGCILIFRNSVIGRISFISKTTELHFGAQYSFSEPCMPRRSWETLWWQIVPTPLIYPLGLVIYFDTDSLLLKLQNENVLLFLTDDQDLGHDFAF